MTEIRMCPLIKQDWTMNKRVKINELEQTNLYWQQIHHLAVLYIISSILAVVLIWSLLIVNGFLGNVLVWVLNVGIWNAVWNVSLKLARGFIFCGCIGIVLVLYYKISRKQLR